MPATAGRVRMPANNRVHSSAALQTHGIWQSAIGYDPYAPTAKEEPKTTQQKSDDPENSYASFQGLLALTRITGSNNDEARGSWRRLGGAWGEIFAERYGKKKKGSGSSSSVKKKKKKRDESESESDSGDRKRRRRSKKRRTHKRRSVSESEEEEEDGRSKRRKERRGRKRDDDDSDESYDEDRRSVKRKSRKEKRRRRSRRNRSDDSDSSEDDASGRRQKRRNKVAASSDSDVSGDDEDSHATPMVAGAAVAAAAIAGRYGIHSWQAFKARPIVPRMRKFYEERQGGELKGVDMLLLDAKVIKKSLYSNFLKSRLAGHNHLEVNQPSNCLHSSNISCKKAWCMG
ncbi:unnamed protein product [Brassica rapa]|uniref:Uncharacterized protein n=1 Tax=Brassica campestris TaxID=3711 RepID=A0A8D9HPS7_BRACM|nr:unnamed protein product [Brassica rapa]